MIGGGVIRHLRLDGPSRGGDDFRRSVAFVWPRELLLVVAVFIP
jgi:hypothetical protein